MEKAPFGSIPFETPGGRPVIAVIGEVFTADDIVLMERAAEELNLTEDQPRYQVVIDRDDMFAANGTRLPEDSFRVRLQGSWQEDKNIAPLWERIEELRSEQTQQ